MQVYMRASLNVYCIVMFPVDRGQISFQHLPGALPGCPSDIICLAQYYRSFPLSPWLSVSLPVFNYSTTVTTKWGEESLSAVFTFPLTRLWLISEVRVEPRDRHYSKAWVITSLCTHTLEYLSGNTSCIWNTNASLSPIWATVIIKLKIQ